MSTLTQAWLLGHKSTSFYSHTYYPPTGSPTRAALVFVHGFAEHVGRYEYVHKRWADRGFFVLAFDQRGFGRTALDEKKSRSQVYGQTNDADQILDIEWALRAAQGANPTVPLFLMGHSMVRPAYLYIFLGFVFKIRGRFGLQGGALVLSFVTRPDMQENVAHLSGIIASSPCIRLTKPPLSFTRQVGGLARAIFPNMNVPASVKPKVHCFLP
jgi:acylglycerol lipase